MADKKSRKEQGSPFPEISPRVTLLTLNFEACREWGDTGGKESKMEDVDVWRREEKQQ